jgi:hypothetical protein
VLATGRYAREHPAEQRTIAFAGVALRARTGEVLEGMGDAEIEAQLGYAPGSLGRMGILKRADDMLDHYTGWAGKSGPLLPRVWSLYDDPEPSQFGAGQHPAPGSIAVVLVCGGSRGFTPDPRGHEPPGRREALSVEW